MTRDDDARLLRRYVIERAAGRIPCPEYLRALDVAPGMVAWQRCTESEARASERWRRLRVPGRPWCPVLGPRTAIARDVTLQSFFATVAEKDWRDMERQVRRDPVACLHAWRDAGRRLLAAVEAAAEGRKMPGKLHDWPGRRGDGFRSLLIQDT